MNDANDMQGRDPVTTGKAGSATSSQTQAGDSGVVMPAKTYETKGSEGTGVLKAATLATTFLAGAAIAGAVAVAVDLANNDNKTPQVASAKPSASSSTSSMSSTPSASSTSSSRSSSSSSSTSSNSASPSGSSSPSSEGASPAPGETGSSAPTHSQTASPSVTPSDLPSGASSSTPSSSIAVPNPAPSGSSGPSRSSGDSSQSQNVTPNGSKEASSKSATSGSKSSGSKSTTSSNTSNWKSHVYFLRSGQARYQVQPGDTVSELAQAMGIKVSTLVAFNEIEDPDMIFIGQSLRVPPAAW